mgnify:CR=1 FL=1
MIAGTTTKRGALLFLIYSLTAGAFLSEAQTEWGKTGTRFLWQGLRDKQPEKDMTVGKALFQAPQRVAKKNIQTRMDPVSPNEWIVSDGWELGTSTQVLESGQSIFSTDFNTHDWYNATVPGTILTTLVNLSLITI